MNIVKQSTGNVVLTDAAGNIQKVFINVNALEVKNSDEIIVKFGFNQWHSIFASQIDNTQVEPAAAVPFSGNAFDLVALLSSSFFFELDLDAQNLISVLGYGNQSGPYDINFDTGQGLLFNNGSRLREGTIDAGLGGQKGIAQICAVGYELKWEAGRLYVMDGNGIGIRWSLYNFNVTPTVTDDDTKGYIIGSLWSLDNGDVYVCSDATTGAAVWVLNSSGTVTSVGLTMPSAFNVANSPITGSGNINVTGAGLVSQYIRGDGTLANFPTNVGGGSSVSYYLNGSVNQGTFGGNVYHELSKTPIIGSGTNFTINADGYIAQFLTDAGDPALLNIPAGNWDFQLYFSASSTGGSPRFYTELYKYDGTTFSLIASGSTSPQNITGGTFADVYVSNLAVPATALTLTDRLAIRVYVIHSGRTITLYTEDNKLAEVHTTFSTGIAALNGLTSQIQSFSTGTTGTDFNISSSTATHTFNIPTASALNRGLLSTTDWSTFNGKESALTFSSPLSRSVNTISIPVATSLANGYLSSSDWTTFNNKQNALGFTPVTDARTITINGSAQNLTADRSWNTYAIVPVQSVVSAATVTPTSTNQLVIITAQAAALTLANPTGAFVEGQPLMIRIKDNGTARAINYDTNYRAIGVTLPTTTVINKTTYLGIIYNAVDAKWDVIGVTTQA